MAKSIDRKRIAVYAHWQGLAEPELMGELLATPVRGQEVFSFAYTGSWLATAPAQVLDPALLLYTGSSTWQKKKAISGCSWIRHRTGGGGFSCGAGRPR